MELTALMRAAASGDAAAVLAVLDLVVADKEARNEDGCAAFLVHGLPERVRGVHQSACGGVVRQGRCSKYSRHGTDVCGCVGGRGSGAGGAGSGRGGQGGAGRGRLHGVHDSYYLLIVEVWSVTEASKPRN